MRATRVFGVLGILLMPAARLPAQSVAATAPNGLSGSAFQRPSLAAGHPLSLAPWAAALAGRVPRARAAIQCPMPVVSAPGGGAGDRMPRARPSGNFAARTADIEGCVNPLARTGPINP